MKKYRIIKNVYDWIGNIEVEDVNNVIVDEDELTRLSQGWGRPVSELLEDLEEVEEDEE